MTNPAEQKRKAISLKDLQPMSKGVPKLEVPEKEGYVRRWFRGDPGRIQRAMRAGWTFADANEVELNNFDLGGDAKADGNTDLGTRVSVISGDEADSTGQPSRLYLMECPEEVYAYSRGFQADRNESIAEALRGGKIGAGYEGESDEEIDTTRYVKGAVPDLFKPKRRT